MVTDSSSATPERLSVTTRERMVSSSWPRFSQVRRNRRARGRFFQDFEKGVLRLLGHILRLGEQEHPSGGLVGQNVGILPQRADGIDMGRNGRPPPPPLRGYPDGNPAAALRQPGQTPQGFSPSPVQTAAMAVSLASVRRPEPAGPSKSRA